MMCDSFISDDFFNSKEFNRLLKEAKNRQLELAKSKIDDFYYSQNPLRKLKAKKRELDSKYFA